MKKLVYFLTTSALLSAGICFSDDNAPATVQTKDGKNTLVFLMGMEGNKISTEFQKLREKKVYAVGDVAALKFSHAKVDLSALEEAYRNADYPKIIQTLNPVVKPYMDYMTVSNNLQEVYVLLLKSCCRNKEFATAKGLADKLLGSENPDLKLQAQVFGAVAAAGLGDVASATKLLDQIKNPAAAAYVKAVVERKKGNHREAIQSAVEVIALHANEMAWMPVSEFLCAELYLDMGRTNSALVTARQVQKLFKGTNIEKEAEAFQLKINQVTAGSK